MMNIKSKISIFAALTFLCSSCNDFLEKPDSTGMTHEILFSTIENAERVLAAAYSCPPWGYPTLNDGGAWSYGILNYFSSLAVLCDEAENATKAENFYHERYNLGKLTPGEISAYTEDKWMFNFQVIRSSWLFYENVDKVKDGTPKNYIDMRKAEALAMIATKYYEMFRRYGGLPRVDKYVELGAEMSHERMSVSATCDFICDLLDRAIPYLPAVQEPGEFGRINKIAAMALKSRTLLVSASPLFNPENNASFYPNFGEQTLIKHESYDIERWKLAADAALLTINEAKAAGYAIVDDPNKTPYENYRSGINDFPETKTVSSSAKPTRNTEIIWGTRLYRSYWEGQGSQRVVPYSKKNFPNGVPYIIPLQDFVDLYEMKDGSKQPADLYSRPNPYASLDTRFDATILYHSRKFGPYNMDMTPTGDNNPGGSQSFTGYYFHKFFSEMRLTNQQGGNPESFWPYIRLAEVYLIYAEALTEYNYNANKDIILTYVNKIRTRAGQPKLEDSPQYIDSYLHVRDRIRNERAIELAFEEQRYFDLKRWKIGEKIGETVHGMKISGAAANPTYEKVVFEERNFTDKWYLYPILESDINKSKGMLQNPGW